MNLHRLRRLRTTWGYLPAFRAVAEAPHLPTAARAIALSAPALSHAVRGLEATLGRPLFERRGRGLALNPEGARLLAALRTSMRLVDEALHGDGRDEEPLRLALAAGTEWLLPGLVSRLPVTDRLRQVAWTVDPEAALVRGDVDLLVEPTARPHRGVIVVPLGEARWRHYGPRRGVGRAVSPGEPSAHGDEPTRVEVADVRAAAALIRECGLVALLPTAVARAFGLRAQTRAAAVRVPMYARHRAPVAAHAQLERALAGLHAVVTSSPRA